MNCSLKKNNLENLEILEQFLASPDFRTFVKKIMLSISDREYLECEGVVEGNMIILARDLRLISKNSPELELAEILEKLNNRYLSSP